MGGGPRGAGEVTSGSPPPRLTLRYATSSAPMAKLDKAPAYEAGDCRFESCSERQICPLLPREFRRVERLVRGLPCVVSERVAWGGLRYDASRSAVPVDPARLACFARNPVGEVAERLKALPC